MKKIIFTLILAAGIFTAASAQVAGSAIGARLTYGAELSYQHALSDANRLELDLGWAAGSTALTGAYHWVNSISSVSGLNWFIGPGAGVGVYSVADNKLGFTAGIVGQIGLEYNFSFPLQLSLDYRPGINFRIGGEKPIDPSYYGVALGIRYVL